MKSGPEILKGMTWNVPYTTSALIDSAERRVVDLTGLGFPEIPVLGMNRSSRTTEGSVFHRHRRCLEITLCTRGSAKFDCDGKVYVLTPGMVFLSCPQDVHRLRMNQRGARLHWLFFQIPEKGRAVLGLPLAESQFLVQALTSLPRRAFAVNDDVRLGFEELQRAYEDRTTGGPGLTLRLRVAALRLLQAVIASGRRKQGEASDRVFRELMEKMRRHPEEAYGNERLVAETHLSPNTILARFRKLTGLPPQTFLVKCRIHRATELLAERKKSITQIAAELGFASSQHFTTRFRQEMGTTPKQWVNLYTKTQCGYVDAEEGRI